MMGKLLAIDIGNTNITIGLFKGTTLAKKTKIPTKSHPGGGCLGKIDSIARGACVESIIISSVVPKALGRLKRILRKRFETAQIKIVGEDIKVPIKNLYRKKSEVGQDRLVNAYAAKILYGAPTVIIDFGTAITFDIVSKKGEYLGGLILPGIEMGLASLYDKTALLPRIRLAPAPYIIGKDTVSSMCGGILFGYGAMCDGLVSKYKKISGKNLKVIATGGNARLIKKYTKSIRVVDEDLTLKGLELIGRKSSTKIRYI